MALHSRQELDGIMDSYVKQGVMEKSSSPWCPTVVLVKKKYGSLRRCVDYWALNDITVKYSYPLPRVDDTLDALSDAKWFQHWI